MASDIVLLPSVPSSSRAHGPLRNKILGTINFDVPFLGMHPGVIASGIGSLFRPAPKSPANEPASDASSLYSVSTQGVPSSSYSLSPQSSSSSNLRDPLPNDPNFNPAYVNDNILPARSGISNAAHFIKKHSKNLRQATKTLVTNHVEFGGAMADYEGLRTRYSRIRMLEEENERARSTVVRSERPPPRVRFANYYTASSGRPKKPAPSAEQAPPESERSADAAPPATLRRESTPALEVEPATPVRALGDSTAPSRVPEGEAEPADAPPAYSDIDFTDSDDNFSDDLEQLGSLDPIDSAEALGSTDTGHDSSPVRADDAADSEYKPMPSLLPPSPPIFRPPFGALKDKDAYKAAFKDYRHQVKEHHQQILAYHQALVDYRKQELARLKKYHNSNVENIQAAVDSRYKELTLRREQRRVEFEARRKKLKQRIDEAKESRKTEREVIKEARKAKANREKETSASSSQVHQDSVLNPEKAPLEPEPAPTKCGSKAARREVRQGAKAERYAAKADYKAERKMVQSLDKADRRALVSERRSERREHRRDRLESRSSTSATDKGKQKGKLTELAPMPDEHVDHETVFDADQELVEAESDDDGDSDSEFDPSGSRKLTPTTSVAGSEPPWAQAPSRPAPPLPSRPAPPIPTASSMSSASARAYGPGEYPPEKGTLEDKPKKDKKFCVLPPADSSGARDATWIRVYMQGVDEIGAHCGLFFTHGAENQEPSGGPGEEDSWSERYAGLVGDVAGRVEGWCLDAMTERMVGSFAGVGT